MIWVNGKEWGQVRFPNNEHQFLCLPDRFNMIDITVRYDGDEDLLALFFALNYLKSKNVAARIHIPYLPYSRADKYTTQNELPVLKCMSDMLNQYNVRFVNTYDVHSESSRLLINNLNELSIIKKCGRHNSYLEQVVSENAVDYIFLPDAGAKKRYEESLKNYKVFCGSKHRGEGGKLSNLTLIDPPDLKDKVVCIVDDICCKGGTAYGFAKLLREAGAKNVILLVTHCEPAIFDGQILKDYTIGKVYTTNSILRKKHEKIQEFDVLNIEEFHDEEWDF